MRLRRRQQLALFVLSFALSLAAVSAVVFYPDELNRAWLSVIMHKGDSPPPKPAGRP